MEDLLKDLRELADCYDSRADIYVEKSKELLIKAEVLRDVACSLRNTVTENEPESTLN